MESLVLVDLTPVTLCDCLAPKGLQSAERFDCDQRGALSTPQQGGSACDVTLIMLSTACLSPKVGVPRPSFVQDFDGLPDHAARDIEGRGQVEPTEDYPCA
jgi:hypothetical protein